MNKKLMATVLAGAMVAGVVAVPAMAEEKESYKVGISLQSLSNPYWAGVMGKLKDVFAEAGWEEPNMVDCQDNSATQVSQVENFITEGVDLIMVHPSDANALEDVCKQAMDAGIKVMCWDDPMENTTANWILDNEVLGEEIGKVAADFIKEHYTEDNKAEVVVIGYPSTKVLLDRANGIKSGLEKYCAGFYEIVAEADGIEVNEAQTNCETAMIANPDAKVFVGVGAGAMIGANEALLAQYGKGSIPEDCGVITTDVTEQQLNSLKAGDEAVRAIVGFEGSNTDTAKACFEMFQRILSGEEFTPENKNVVRVLSTINLENVDDILAGM